MSEAYLGEIRMFAGNYAPAGWAMCNGQMLLIYENEALFSLLGTLYGGDGRMTFALPDLQGRLPIHTSPQYFLGRKGGLETVSLTLAELPAHTHPVGANSIANNSIYSSPENNVWGITGFEGYQTNTASDIVQMSPNLLTYVGSHLSHDNIMPSLTVNFIIALVGIYPTQY